MGIQAVSDAFRSTSERFPLLVVLNPNAGRKEGQEHFSKMVQPALDNSGTPFQLIETTSQGYAQSYFKDNIQQILVDIVQSLALSDASAASDTQPVYPSTVALRIMVLGGDGTVHEVVNGILCGLAESSFVSDEFRPKIELAVIPTGTGNAISTSLGVTSVQDAVDRFLAANSTPLRVIRVSTRSPDSMSDSADPSHSGTWEWNTRVYTLVVNSFGLHCATVHDADGLRFLGNERFKIAALKNILLLKQYKARLDFFGPVERYNRALRELVSTNDGTSLSPNSTGDNIANNSAASTTSTPSLTLLGPFTYLMLTKQASLEPGFRPTPFAKASDEWLDVLAVQNVGRGQILKVLGAAAKEGRHVENEKVEYYKAKAVELETPSGGQLCIDGEFLKVGAGPQGRVRFEVVSNPNLQLFHVYG